MPDLFPVEKVDATDAFTEPGSLEAAGIVAWLFSLPPKIEIREIHAAAITTTFGVFPEVFEKDG